MTHLYRDLYIQGGYRGGDASGAHAGDSEGMDTQGGHDQSPLIQVKPFNLRTHHRIRDLDPNHIDKLVSIKGIVIRNSDIIPEMKEASFKCQKCGL